MERIAPMVYFLLILVVALITALGLLLKRQQQQKQLYQISRQQIKESQLQQERLQEQLQAQLQEQLKLRQLQSPQSSRELESSIEAQVQARLKIKLKELELWEDELAIQEANLEERQTLETLVRQLQSEKAQLNEERRRLDEDFETFDDIVKTEVDRQVAQKTLDLQAPVEQLRSRVETLRAENQRLYRQLSRANGASSETDYRDTIVIQANEVDLYEQEKLGIILDALSHMLRQTAQEQERRQDVLTDILNCNPHPSTSDQLKRQLKQLFTGYQTMNPQFESDLNKLGFEIHSENRHYKLYFKDDSRYPIIISKTSSDRRAGMNMVSQMTRKLL